MVDKNDKSLVAWCRMENSQNSEMGQTGTPVNITYSSGGAKRDGVSAAVFNGTDSKITYAISTNIAAGCTLAAWVKLTTNTGTGSSTVISIGDDTNFLHLQVSAKATPDTSTDGIRLAGSGFDDTFLSGSQSPPPISEWFHAAATFDGTTFRAYLNGVLVASDTSALSTWNGDVTEMVLGTVSVGAETFHDLELDDVRVYNRFLNEEEIGYIIHGRGYWDKSLGFN